MALQDVCQLAYLANIVSTVKQSKQVTGELVLKHVDGVGQGHHSLAV